MPEQNSITQNPMDFAVQIRHVEHVDSIVGTGVAIPEGQIVTCAHVIEDAGVDPYAPQGQDLPVYYQSAPSGEKKVRRAKIAVTLDRNADDIVVLQLLDGQAPLGPEQIAVLGNMDNIAGHDFRSFGYRRLGKYQGLPAFGKIVGFCAAPEGCQLRAAPVVDEQNNLVVGIISETWDTAGALADRDTNFGVHSHVLTFDPFNFALRDTPLPKRAGPQPQALPDPRMALLRPRDKLVLHGAPSVLDEWVGRDDLLRKLDDDWADPDTRVTALVGFGGEGKSSLARTWVDRVVKRQTANVKRQTSSGKGQEVTHDASRFSPDGVFWWSFYDDPSVEAFFEAALDFLSGGQIDPRHVPSASAKGHLIAGLMAGGRYLFVLDGFEVMQHAEGDAYGLVRSNDLRAFLEYAAAPGHPSFCLVTSRAPVLDLLAYTTATQRDVTRLSAADGRALLRAVGVRCRGDGPAVDADLDRVVQAWDGHALTLSLLGSYLAEQHGGDLAHLDDLPAPTADEARYARVHRVLRRYDDHLTGAEREFLTLFSAFRTPVGLAAFDRVFRNAGVGARHAPQDSPGPNGHSSRASPLRGMDDDTFKALVGRLVQYRLLRHIAHRDTYTAHPLVRAHYAALFTRGDDTAEAHTRIKDYYLEIAGDTPTYPTLDDLRPLIEVVHHACRAGAYDEAFNDVYWQRIQQIQRGVLVQQLGAWETDLSLLFEFFPGGDAEAGEPQVSDPSAKRWILNEVGLCLMSLGRLREAVPFYARGNAIALEMEDWHNASIGTQNLADLHLSLGDLLAGADAAQHALALARKEENQQAECTSLARAAWAAHLRGELAVASAAFSEAEALEKEIDNRKQYLFSLRGIWHATHLHRLARLPRSLLPTSYAPTSDPRAITEANLEILERRRAPHQISMCHRVLGDLDSAAGHPDSARDHYDAALRIARGISHRPALIEALLGRGRYLATGQIPLAESPAGILPLRIQQAFSDLNEALAYALQGGYRVYEADIRLALAEVHRAAGDMQRARQEAQRARALSEEMGYYWGKVRAEELALG